MKKPLHLILPLLLASAVGSQAAVTLVAYNFSNSTTALTNSAANVTADANITVDITGDINGGISSTGFRVNGIGDNGGTSGFSDTERYFGFAASTTGGNVFDFSEDGIGTPASDPATNAFATILLDRVSGNAPSIELVIWQGTDRTGSELFRGEFANGGSSDVTNYFGPIPTIDAAANISQIYVQFNYSGVGSSAFRFDQIQLHGSVIPEPTTLSALLGAVGMLTLVRRRK